MRGVLQGLRDWFDRNFTLRGLLAFLFWAISAIPDWVSNFEFWKGRVPKIIQFLLTPTGRFILILLGIFIVWLDHRSVLRKRRNRGEETALQLSGALVVSDSDPRPYLEIKEAGDSMFVKTEFILHNRGGDVAHRVQIRPISVGYRTVTFPQVATIPKNENRKTFSIASGSTSQFNQNNFFHWLMEDWNEKAKATGSVLEEDYAVDVEIDFEDYSSQKKFEAKSELIFHPVRYLVAHDPIWRKPDQPLWEIGAPTFRRVDKVGS
jgi:hypothetical protein